MNFSFDLKNSINGNRSRTFKIVITKITVKLREVGPIHCRFMSAILE